MLVSFVLSFFPRDVLDEILNLIGSVSEGFPSYSSTMVLGKLSVSERPSYLDNCRAKANCGLGCLDNFLSGVNEYFHVNNRTESIEH